MASVTRRFAPVLLLGFALAAAGCGGPGGSATVTGKIAYQGKSVVTGQVVIANAEKVMYGAIEPDGTYIVMDAPTGKVKIGVVSPKPVPPPASADPTGRAKSAAAAPAVDPTKWFALPNPENLADPEKSGLEATLKSGSNTHDINIP